MPSRESLVRRLNFCEWTDAINPWIGRDMWEPAEVEDGFADLNVFRGRRCFAGLDLGSTTDMTALVLLFEPRNANQRWAVVPFYWRPEERLVDAERRDNVPYTQWRRDGHIETTPGKAISKLVVMQRIAQLDQQFTIEWLAYDRWRMEDLKALADSEGIALPPMESFGQGFKDMSPAVEETERLLLSGQIEHGGHPVLTWNVANATLETDAAGNRKPSKRRSTSRIDGLVALVMAVGVSLRHVEDAAPQIAVL
jgi:phage terminase large subunit-like protein